MKVWLSADTIGYPDGGGYVWGYLNYALGLRSLGCEVTWLEGLGSREPDQALQLLGARLEPYGLGESVVLWSWGSDHVGLEEAGSADLLLNLRYDTPADIVRRFRRTALVDIDPGLLQTWLARGDIRIPDHDVYFTTGEGVASLDPTRRWLQTRECVALDWWPPADAQEDAAFTTVSHWWADEWFESDGHSFRNDKRSSFVDYFDLPRHSDSPLELALSLSDEDVSERRDLVARGWRIRDSSDVASTPTAYQRYIQGSLGEFTCVKPSCVFLQNAWIGDRTICYLASAKPAVVQHTGPSRILPEAAGLWRFRDLAEAARHLESVASDYERQCRLARELAEEHFDARTVVARLLERALS